MKRKKKNSNCDKTQNSNCDKTQIATKLRNSNSDNSITAFCDLVMFSLTGLGGQNKSGGWQYRFPPDPFNQWLDLGRSVVCKNYFWKHLL